MSRATVVSKPMALALAAAAMLGSVVPMGPTSASPYQDVRISMPSNPAPARAIPQATAARNEIERTAEAQAVPQRLYRPFWDGKNRTSGDRSHKRMKRRRASGRR